MDNRKRLLCWLIVLFFSGLVVFWYRYEILHYLQLRQLRSISAGAIVSNQSLQVGPIPSRHQVYSLKGIDRIWPHRVNSLKRLRYLYPEFAGFECDIRFDAASGKLYIAHDAGDISSLLFTDYLSGSDPLHKLFWMDVKNLGNANRKTFCEKLEELDRQYSIRQRVIVETYDTASARLVKESGFFTSYCMTNTFPGDGHAQQACIRNMGSFLQNNVACISQDIRMHDFITRNFPGRKQLTWDIGFLNGLDRDRLLKNANDTTLLVCLVNIKSPGYR